MLITGLSESQIIEYKKKNALIHRDMQTLLLRLFFIRISKNNSEKCGKTRRRPIRACKMRRAYAAEHLQRWTHGNVWRNWRVCFAERRERVAHQRCDGLAGRGAGAPGHPRRGCAAAKRIQKNSTLVHSAIRMRHGAWHAHPCERGEVITKSDGWRRRCMGR